MYYCGIDIGSRTSKIAVFKSDEMVYDRIVMTGLIPGETAMNLKLDAQEALNAEEDFKVIATGYGRNTLETGFRAISEISCHAKGINYLFPQADMIIDIGGQDSKGILVGENGKVSDFVMNDRCAAGSGRFLEKLAEILEIRIDQLGDLMRESTEDIEINSTCVVFAESEIIGQIAKGVKPADIAAGGHHALARRIRNLVAQFRGYRYIVFTGGVALNDGMTLALENVFEKKILVAANPVITGAIGAALFAKNEK